MLFIHARLIAETGGAYSVRERGLLLSAVAHPQVTIDGPDLYPDLFSKTIALLESLVGSPALLDRNKRPAITSAGLFLWINGHRLNTSNQELETFTLQCAQRLVPLDQNTQWFKAYSERVP